MKPRGKVIFLGWIKDGSIAADGESMKNQLCIRRMEKLGVKCFRVDTSHWKHHKLRALRLPWLMLTHPRATLVFSSSAQNIYPLMKILKFCHLPHRLIHWVIGGSLGDRIENGMFKASVINRAEWTLVESADMVRQLEAQGIRNVLEVPNFKPVPSISPKKSDAHGRTRFVFLSRIVVEKGCSYILDSAAALNGRGYEDKFSVDFYGQVGEPFKEEFFSRVERLGNVTYKGFLDLKEKSGYEVLSGYDMMLFPTYWRGEGFPGIFIDAFIAGLPVIATDWAHNRVILSEGQTAVFIPPHDPEALEAAMENCVSGEYDLGRMSAACLAKAADYDVRNVVSESLLKKIGIL